MTDDPADEDGEPEQPEGVRKDGKPFKHGNTRDDGSYEVGKNRTPVEHRFAKGDGRTRGRRPKGSKNLDRIWSKELAKKRKIDGRTRQNLEWVVEGTLRRAIAKSDRAAETVYARAEHLERKKERGLGITDREAIEAWMAQRSAQDEHQVMDDADRLSSDDANADHGGEADVDQ